MDDLVELLMLRDERLLLRLMKVVLEGICVVGMKLIDSGWILEMKVNRLEGEREKMERDNDGQHRHLGTNLLSESKCKDKNLHCGLSAVVGSKIWQSFDSSEERYIFKELNVCVLLTSNLGWHQCDTVQMFPSSLNKLLCLFKRGIEKGSIRVRSSFS